MLIRTKLLASFGGLGLLAGAIVAVALVTFADVLRDAEQMQHTWMRSARQLEKVNHALNALRSAGDDSRPSAESAGRELRLRFEVLGAELDVLVSLAEEGLARIRAGEKAEENDALRVVELTRHIRAPVQGVRSAVEEHQRLWSGDRRAARVIWQDRINPILTREVGPRVREYYVLTQHRTEKESLQISESIRQARWVILAGAGCICLMAILMGVHVTHSIAVPLAGLKRAVEAVGQGGRAPVALGSRSDELDRLAEAFNTMTSQLEATTVSKTFVDTILSSMPAGLIVLRPSGEIVSANASAAALFQIPLEHLAGRVLSDLMRDSDGTARLDQWVRLLCDAGTVPAQEWMCLRPEGGTTPVLLAGAKVAEPARLEPVLLCGLQDITARKSAEAETARLNRELVRSSRLAGMAEVATGVLHNVGNVLTSANVSANLMTEHLGRTRTASLGKVVALLRQNQNDLPAFFRDHPHGRQITEFLDALAQHLSDQQSVITQELQSLQANLDHIKGIVAMQQSYAGVSGALESVQLRDVLEDALAFVSTGLNRHQVEIERAYAPMPAVVIDRHKVLQILVNLVQNAKQALAHRAEGRRLILRIQAAAAGRVRVEVCDNGAGIARENLNRIFSHGFTTKEDGHGFGLHSGANAAKEMGGCLTVTSEGPGLGATFVLELPLAAAATAAATEEATAAATEEAAAA